MNVSVRLFFIAGIVFMVVAIMADKIAVFLPIGIAVLVIGIMEIRSSRKSEANKQEQGSEWKFKYFTIQPRIIPLDASRA